MSQDLKSKLGSQAILIDKSLWQEFFESEQGFKSFYGQLMTRLQTETNCK